MDIVSVLVVVIVARARVKSIPASFYLRLLFFSLAPPRVDYYRFSPRESLSRGSGS